VGGLSLPDNIHVTFESGEHDLSSQALYEWIARAHKAITTYFGRFPVPQLDLHVSFSLGRSGVSRGKTWCYRGALIRITVGQKTTQAELNDDWMLVHEMVHLALPSVGDDQHWMEEGSATYIEPIARVMIGNLTAQRVWGDMVRDMPQGVPRSGERGLDFTQSWASTYWGGALFWLLADVEIRKRTSGRMGLQQAMQGILSAGGNILTDWPAERVLATGDRATRGDELQSLYNRIGRHYMDVDLAQLWDQLGVNGAGGHVTFDDSKPLAYVRRAIMA
jgi:hypothetical protein